MRKRLGQLIRPLCYLWTLPNTLIGLSILPLLLIRGGSIKLVSGVIEIEGRAANDMLSRWLPKLKWLVSGPALAITLGHVVWGCDQKSLDRTRKHERVHVRQYEHWGPLFIPAYLICATYIGHKGGDPYLDNPFEVEAYAIAP